MKARFSNHITSTYRRVAKKKKNFPIRKKILLAMERSGNQQRSHAQANNRNNHIHTLLSPLTWSTIYKVLQKRRRGVRDGTRCTFHDNSCNGFGWLLPGWVAEERVKQTGRVYRVTILLIFYTPFP